MKWSRYLKMVCKSIIPPMLALVVMITTLPTASQVFAVPVIQGVLLTWGNNSNGQLGNGTTTSSSFPVQTNISKNIIAMSGGEGFSLALKSDGTVWSWGFNGSGQLGDNTTTGKKTPVQVVNTDLSGFINDITAVAGGSNHSLALDSSGNVWAWGTNTEGELGIGQPNGSSVPYYVAHPVQVKTSSTTVLTGIVAISAGFQHSLALDSSGNVWAWGADYYGQLGNGNSGDYANVFYASQVKKSSAAGDYLSNITAISASMSGSSSMALDSSGYVWGWGYNSSGQLGIGDPDSVGYNIVYPAQVKGAGGSGSLSDITAISAGLNFCLAVDSDRSIWAWGNNSRWQLGNGSNTNSLYPVNVVGADGSGTLNNITTISAGSEISLAVDLADNIWAWGDNSGAYSGQNGVPRPIATSTFFNENLGDVIGIAAGSNHSLAIVLDRPVIDTYALQPGYVNSVYSQTLTVDGGTGSNTLTLTAGSLPDGLVMSTDGVISGTPEAAGTFNFTVQVDDGNLTSIRDLTIKIGTSGVPYVYSWGSNNYGELGVASPNVIPSPVPIDGFSDIVSVAGNNESTLALKSDGTVWGIGLNSSGQLGNGTNTNSSIPVQVTGVGGVDYLSDIVAISADGGHCLALDKNGNVWAWGYNSHGELGDGTLTSKNTPIQVKGPGGTGYLTGVAAIAAGREHSLALKSDGTLWAWGNDHYSQLGYSSSDVAVTTPKQVYQYEPMTKFVDIAAGDYHNLAIRSDGTLWAWGASSLGQLGNGSSSGTYGQYTPSKVSSFAGVAAIAGGGYFSLALKSDGTVWAWGDDSDGQIGNGTITSTPVTTPVQVSSLTNITAIAAGYAYGLALKSDGTMYSWGSDLFGSLGDGNSGETSNDRDVPYQIPGLSNVKLIGSGYGHSIAVSTTVPSSTAFNINVSVSGGNGSAAADPTTVDSGGSSTITLAPDTGYHLSALTDNSVDVFSQVSNGAYTISNINEDHNVTATFAINTCTISVSASPEQGGSVTGGGIYDYGDTVNLNATANTGYYFVNWTEGTTDVADSAAFSFSASADRILTANFEVNPVFAITTSSLPDGEVGISYQPTILSAENGIPPYTWSLAPDSPPLPAGLLLVSDNGTISGTPIADGSADVIFQVSDDDSQTATRTLTITVHPVVSVAGGSLPDGTTGSHYAQALPFSGGSTNNSWSITDGALPGGLSLASSTGIISGTPTLAVSANFTARVQDSLGGVASGNFTLTINPAPPVSGGGIYVPVFNTLTTSGFSPATVYIDFNGYIRSSAAQLTTPDGKVRVSLPYGSRLVSFSGGPLSSFSVAIPAPPPAPTVGSVLVSVYTFGPAGAKFSPALTVTLNYDPSALPSGAAENDLYIAYYDGAKWVALDSKVDTQAKTVSAAMAGTGTYAIVSRAAPATITTPVPATPPAQKPTSTPAPVSSPTPVPAPPTTSAISTPAVVTPSPVLAGDTAIPASENTPPSQVITMQRSNVPLIIGICIAGLIVVFFIVLVVARKRGKG